MFSKLKEITKFNINPSDDIAKRVLQIQEEFAEGLHNILQKTFLERMSNPNNSGYGPQDVEAIIEGYAKKNMDLALKYFDFNHENLKSFLERIINVFGQHKPTLRDAKIVSVIGKQGTVTRQQILDSLYNGPTSTDNRAVNNLINFGLVQSKDDDR